jgi:hypothetical protein
VQDTPVHDLPPALNSILCPLQCPHSVTTTSNQACTTTGHQLACTGISQAAIAMCINMQERHAQGWSAILMYSNSGKFIKAAFIYPKNSFVDFVQYRPQCPDIDIMQCHSVLIPIFCIIILLKQEFLSFYLPRLLAGHMPALQTANYMWSITWHLSPVARAAPRAPCMMA